jgi:hypothetical protein
MIGDDEHHFGLLLVDNKNVNLVELVDRHRIISVCVQSALASVAGPDRLRK